MNVEAAVNDALVQHLADRLSGIGFAGLQWSSRMPVDDPNATFLVVTASGDEYVLEVEVVMSKVGA